VTLISICVAVSRWMFAGSLSVWPDVDACSLTPVVIAAWCSRGSCLPGPSLPLVVPAPARPTPTPLPVTRPAVEPRAGVSEQCSMT
jgi:hypothetical protein